MRSAERVWKCLLSGVDRTYPGHHQTDAFDPQQTSETLSAQENPAKRNPSR
jgi:hypothetical protein